MTSVRAIDFPEFTDQNGGCVYDTVEEVEWRLKRRSVEDSSSSSTCSQAQHQASQLRSALASNSDVVGCVCLCVIFYICLFVSFSYLEMCSETSLALDEFFIMLGIDMFTHGRLVSDTYFVRASLCSVIYVAPFECNA